MREGMLREWDYLTVERREENIQFLLQFMHERIDELMAFERNEIAQTVAVLRKRAWFDTNPPESFHNYALSEIGSLVAHQNDAIAAQVS